ncbi:uncharacterized protein [Ptychodera flava]|uniref:uncharacterized protein n=1 Tax=Ptychodera flava TaxID=63121 RepID=UPI00396A6EFF
MAMYKDNAKVIEDLERVFTRYTHLKICTDKYTYDDGSQKVLLNLYGTVAVCYQGNNYNVPIRIWLQRTHPEDAPICYVEPTNDMYVEPSQYVDTSGKIYLPYLNQWRTRWRLPKHDNNSSPKGSSLSLASTSSLDSSTSDYSTSDQPYIAHAESCKQFLHKAVSKYKFKDDVKRDVFEALADHRFLKPQQDDWDDGEGKMKKTLNLSGTIVISYQGNNYNIPVCIWILRDYPESRPLCFVRPTHDMAIKASPVVDPAGKIMLPYLQNWKHPNNDLHGLLQVIAIEFGKDCPIYSKAGGSQTNPPTNPAMSTIDTRRPSNTPYYMTPSSWPVSSPSQPPVPQESNYVLPSTQQSVYTPLEPTQPSHYMPMHAVRKDAPVSYYNLGDGTDTPPEHRPPLPPTPQTRGMANRPLPPVPGQPVAGSTLPTVRQPLPPRPDEARLLQEQLAQAKKEIELLTLRAKTRELEEAQMCSICMEERKDTAFQCGHMTCKDCAIQLHNCPICRQAIEKRINLYQC